MQGYVHRSQQQVAAAAIRQVFAADGAAEARSRRSCVVATLEAAAPKVGLLKEIARKRLDRHPRERRGQPPRRGAAP
jgi:hypothetical protein